MVIIIISYLLQVHCRSHLFIFMITKDATAAWFLPPALAAQGLAVTPASPGSSGSPAPMSLLLLCPQRAQLPPGSGPYLKWSLSNVFARLRLMSAGRLAMPDSTSPVWMALRAQPGLLVRNHWQELRGLSYCPSPVMALSTALSPCIPQDQ